MRSKGGNPGAGFALALTIERADKKALLALGGEAAAW
jgi:hypothetical protein